MDLTEQIYINKKDRGMRKFDEILDFIHKNYNDSNMSLAILADSFNMNYQYISKLFIAKTGTYFVNYLNVFRLEKSRELLDTTDLLVEEIAHRVGFTSGNSYIRTFKKYYRITPGQYKKNSK